MHNGLAGSKNTFAVGITAGCWQIANHVLLHFLGSLKAKHRQISQVEFDELLPFVFHLPSRVHDGSAYVVQHMRQFGGFGNQFHGVGHGGGSALQSALVIFCQRKL